MLVLLIMVFSLVEHLTPFHYTDLGDDKDDTLKVIDNLIKEHPKFLFLAIIPVQAIISYLFFRKADQNYSEHFVLNSFKTSATIILNILFLLLVTVFHDIPTERVINNVLGWIVTAYGVWFYYQYFSPWYSNRFLLLVRSLLCTLLPLLIFTLALVAYFLLFHPEKSA
jgi:hypothetical protein